MENGNFVDTRDGREYKTIKIGRQVWMAENLAYLPKRSKEDTESYNQPRYYTYLEYFGKESWRIDEAELSNEEKENKQENLETYGVLYNWPAAMKSAPEGWHLPADMEWEEFIEYLRKNVNTITKMNNPKHESVFKGFRLGYYKYFPFVYKIDPDLAISHALRSKSDWTNLENNRVDFVRNTTGFNALPAGHRKDWPSRNWREKYEYLGGLAQWWSSYEYYSEFSKGERAYYRELEDGIWGNVSFDRREVSRKYGLSVRCIKDYC